MTGQETLKKFERLYNETYTSVLKYVVCNCSNIEDVKDIMQNIYIAVYQNIDNIDNTNYIIGIAKNKIKDFYRFNYKVKFISLFSTKDDFNLLENISSDIDVEKSVSDKYDVELVWNYLKRKNVIIAKIFYLYYYLELTIKEIAVLLNITDANVKNYLYRTLKELNSCLKERNENK